MIPEFGLEDLVPSSSHFSLLSIGYGLILKFLSMPCWFRHFPSPSDTGRGLILDCEPVNPNGAVDTFLPPAHFAALTLWFEIKFLSNSTSFVASNDQCTWALFLFQTSKRYLSCCSNPPIQLPLRPKTTNVLELYFFKLQRGTCPPLVPSRCCPLVIFSPTALATKVYISDCFLQRPAAVNDRAL